VQWLGTALGVATSRIKRFFLGDSSWAILLERFLVVQRFGLMRDFRFALSFLIERQRPVKFTGRYRFIQQMYCV